LTVQDWVDAGFHNLKPGGSLTLIHRADYTDKILQALGRKFGAVEIIPLYPKAEREAVRVIIRAVKDRRTPARICPAIVLHEESGTYTHAADAILRDGAAIG
jgi:tRNA1(Val) A37 N6-methylase TrmN6